MGRTYLFSPAGRKQLDSFMAKNPLVAFDFDGTLAPIRKNPGAVGMDSPIKRLLKELLKRRPVIIITGRASGDLKKLLGMDQVPVIGNHGLEDKSLRGGARFRKTVKKWNARLSMRFAGHESITIENKNLSLSVHYRGASSWPKARREILEAVSDLRPVPHVIGGKAVFNLLPTSRSGKGQALLRSMKKMKCGRAIFVGDDMTDEDVFSLKTRNILSVRVGQARTTSAACFLKNQREVGGLLRLLLDFVRAPRV